MLTLCITLLLVTTSLQELPFSSFSSLQQRFWALQYLTRLRYTQLQSHFTQQNIYFQPNSLTTPEGLTAYSNRHRLGFKPNFKTPYAGSLFIQSPKHTYRITFSVGLSILRWYD